MTDLLKVKDEQGLARDPVSKAILRTDTDVLQDHRRRKKLLSDAAVNSQRIEALNQEVAALKDNQEKMLAMLQALLDKA